MRIFRIISALLLSALVLVSSTSFVVGIHICMGDVQDVALLSKTAECGMQRNLPPCHKQMTSSCCDNETVVHNADDLKTSLSEIHVLVPAVDIDQPLVMIAEIVPSAPIAQAFFRDYHPPFRSVDLTVENQSFLI